MVHVSSLAAVGLAAAVSVQARQDSRAARSEKAERWHARRAARGNGGLNRRVTPPAGEATSTSENWSGAVLEGTNWQTVVADVVVPTPKTPSGGSSSKQFSGAAWVGIDGDSCQSALWQTGIDFYVQNGKVSYDAWWEWYPADVNFFNADDISVDAGDKIYMQVTATSKTKGTAILINRTTGQEVSKTTTSSHSLCLEDADWIVEDFDGVGTAANWGTITFTNASATTTSGTKAGPANADYINLINANKKVLTSTSSTSTTVVDTYTAG